MSRFSSPRIIKKYGNRRLYDTEDSHYLTQDQLADKIASGVDVRVVDAKSGRDLTQSTLAQIVFEGREAHMVLPAPALHAFVRMGDAELAEFLGRQLPVALEQFLSSGRGQGMRPAYGPPVRVYDESEPGTATGYGMDTSAGTLHTSAESVVSDIAEIRRDLDELKTLIRDTAEGRTEGRARGRRKRAQNG